MKPPAPILPIAPEDGAPWRAVASASTESALRAPGLPGIPHGRLVEALSFGPDDITAGSETELQAAVAGLRGDTHRILYRAANGDAQVRVPISYLLKLILAEIIGCREHVPALRASPREDDLYRLICLLPTGIHRDTAHADAALEPGREDGEVPPPVRRAGNG